MYVFDFVDENKCNMTFKNPALNLPFKVFAKIL